MKKIVRVNMSDLSIREEEMSKSDFWLGGRGLTTRIVVREVEPGAHPLGPNNKIVFAPGSLGGTGIPCSGRLSVGAKSPLTGGIKESNAGGMAAQRLSALGIAALVLEGKPADGGPYVLWVGKSEARLLPAHNLKGLGNYELVEQLLDSSKGAATISIGPAGENCLSAAGVAVTNIEGYPSRFAARGGLGAVMGSKGMKAILIEKSESVLPGPADRETFKKIYTQFAREVSNLRKDLAIYGTANLVSLANEMGGLPTRNYSTGKFEDVDKIHAGSLVEIINQRGGKMGHPCHPGCVIRCSNIYNDSNGDYLTSSLEYETIALLGSNCGISDLDAIATMDRLCDDYGLDTIEMGATLAVAMEAGILEFGDVQGAIGLLHQVGKGSTVMGRLLGQGVQVAGRVLGVNRVPAVKGQSMAAYDPRVFKGTGITYATSPMGADHTAGNLLPGKTGYSWSTRKGVARCSQVEGQWLLSEETQVITAVCDITGLCFFIGTTRENMDYVARLFNAYYGIEVDRYDVLQWGRQVIMEEKDFNRRAGFAGIHDRLPEFFYTEPLPPTDEVFDIPDSEIKKVLR
ncbi:MAG: aldehyde ferredoxin oxidoreductase C-terminal domain-containing protein [Bacillota bacterium]